MPTSGHKRLALFLDGTWNQTDDNTNIWRLRSLIKPTGDDGREQHAYYSTGLGTKFGEKIRGGMFGWGIDTAITSAYEWLIDNYEDHDEIFIFGFSRGAYTARSLSGFISKCGLLFRGAPLGVNQLFKRYRAQHGRTIRELKSAQNAPEASFSDEEGWLLQYSRAVPIKFIGVFDTVGALGVPFPLLRAITGSGYQFLNTGLRINNDYAFHALAVDEHRKAFAPTLWTNQGATSAAPRPMEKTEQRWFIGAHANVGGGCFTDPLAQLPFDWIKGKAVSLGLSFDPAPHCEYDVAKSEISNSFVEFAWGLYKLARLGVPYQRDIGIPPKSEGRGVSNINETIDASVFKRWKENKDYRPAGLARWAKSKNVDPASIDESVHADNGSVVS